MLADPNIDVNAVMSNSAAEVRHGPCKGCTAHGPCKRFTAPHGPCKGCTALILACWKGHSSIVSTLLRKGADVHSYTRDGLTCLHMAAFSGHIDVVNILLHGKIRRDQWETCDLDHMAAFYRKRKVSLPGDDDERLELLLSFSKSRWALIKRQSAIEEFTALHLAPGGVAADDSIAIAKSILSKP